MVVLNNKSFFLSNTANKVQLSGQELFRLYGFFRYITVVYKKFNRILNPNQTR